MVKKKEEENKNVAKVKRRKLGALVGKKCDDGRRWDNFGVFGSIFVTNNGLIGAISNSSLSSSWCRRSHFLNLNLWLDATTLLTVFFFFFQFTSHTVFVTANPFVLWIFKISEMAEIRTETLCKNSNAPMRLTFGQNVSVEHQYLSERATS